MAKETVQYWHMLLEYPQPVCPKALSRTILPPDLQRTPLNSPLLLIHPSPLIQVINKMLPYLTCLPRREYPLTGPWVILPVSPWSHSRCHLTMDAFVASFLSILPVMGARSSGNSSGFSLYCSVLMACRT
jgi:hypothetical protein